MSTTGYSQWFRPSTGTAGAFSGAFIWGLAQGATIAASDIFTLGTTGGWPALHTVYDTDSYWDAGNTRFNIPEDGYYQVLQGSTVSFVSPPGGVADVFVVWFEFNTGHSGIQANWLPGTYNMTNLRGGHVVMDHFTAGDWIKLNLENDGTQGIIWDHVTFQIWKVG